MVNFSKLPCEIRENIFSRIRFRDLYEVSAVSEEWWWMTIRTYKGILSEDGQLIKTLLAFYNREKQPSTPLMWFELVKYGDFSEIKLHYMPHRTVLETFLQSRKPIRSLYLTLSFGHKFRAQCADIESFKTNMDNLLKYFPHLEKLKLNGFAPPPGSLKIPKGIKHVSLSSMKARGVAWSSFFESPDSIQSLKLEVFGEIIYDDCTFKNLTSLSLHFEHDMPNSILNFIRGHKLLKSVKLMDATLTKGWRKVFGQTIENIFLEDIYMDEETFTALGNERCYERFVMSYVCTDLRTLKRFTLRNLNMKKFDGGPEESVVIHEDGEYICKPQLMEEELSLHLSCFFDRQVKAITNTDVTFALRDLFIVGDENLKTEQLMNCVPASVKKFHLQPCSTLCNLSIGQLCQQPENIEELNFDSVGFNASLSIQRHGFASCTHLKILHLDYVNREGMQNLLQQCVSLEKLILRIPMEDCFTDLSPTCVSQTIREVNIYEIDEPPLEDVLYLFPNLEVLRLSLNYIRPISVPTGVAKLKLFSITVNHKRNNYPSLALVMDTVDVPCKLFHFNGSFSCEFLLAHNESFMNEFHRRNEYIKEGGYAYCCGIPTRFLSATGIKVLSDIKQFSLLTK